MPRQKPKAYRPIVLSGFGGIAPRYGASIPEGFAQTAENCDLSSKKLLPIKDHLLIEANTNGHNCMAYHADDWYTGDDKHYLSWPIGSNNLLIYLESGVPMKEVAGIAATLGHDPPPVSASIAIATTDTDLSDPDDYLWLASENSPLEAYVVNPASTIDILQDRLLTSLAGTRWVDTDTGAPQGESTMAVLHDTKYGLELDSNTHAAVNVAQRTRTIGDIPDTVRLEFTFHCHAIGTLANSDYFRIEVDTTHLQLFFIIASDGIYCFDGAAYNLVDADVTAFTGGYGVLAIEVDGSTPASATCDIYVDGVSVGTGIDCSNVAGVPGTIGLTQFGVTTDNKLTYVNLIRIGGVSNPGFASKPDEVWVSNGTTDLEMTEGTAGSLADNEWGWGDIDGLGFDTVYLKYKLPDDQRRATMTESAVGTNTEYYVTPVDSTEELVLYGTEELMLDGETYVMGEPGELEPGEWGIGNNDTLDNQAIYVCPFETAATPLDYQYLYLKDATGSTRKFKFRGVDEEITYTVRAVWEPGEVTGDVYYVFTTTRNVGGHTDESGPSSVSSAVAAGDKGVAIDIAKPAITESYVTHWNVYRLGTGGEYQFIVQNTVATATYQDTMSEADALLNVALSTEYTSDQGNTITWAPPSVTFDGLSIDIHAGILFGWNDQKLYWCEPGHPDAWPGYYYLNSKHNIKSVAPIGGSVAVLTDHVPFRVDGSHPELLDDSRTLGTEPAMNSSCVRLPQGIAYICDSGVALFNLSTTQVLTDANFTEEWFSANVTLGTAFLAYSDSRLYLFHSTGTICFDMRVAPAIVTTMTVVATAAVDVEGVLYFLDSTGIKQMYGASTYLDYTWHSGDLTTPNINRNKAFIEATVNGFDDVDLTLYVDRTQKATKTLDFDSELERDRMLKFPEHTYGRSVQVKFEGNGEVDEMILEWSN